jgi:uncharacterized protein (TIGR03118 family)
MKSIIVSIIAFGSAAQLSPAQANTCTLKDIAFRQSRRKVSVRKLLFGICIACIALDAGAGRADAQNYLQTNLVSDLPGVAANVDPNLVNPWGLASSPSSPIWVSDNGMGVATLYNSAGVPQSLVVTIPPPTGSGTSSAPTGVVFNPTTTAFGGSNFIFATEDGTIASWKGANGTSAVQDFPAGNPTGVYKGLAIGTAALGPQLYATNFRAGTVDVFNSNFSQVLQPGFIDPNLPAGYAPFGINNIGGKIYVTYAVQDAAKHDDVAGPGNGLIDVYDTNGNFLARLVTGGVLNSPWGLALAPSNFGVFSNDLLVGNFGDGTINAFNITTGQSLGELKDAQGNPIVNLGLWGLLFGNGGNGGATNQLFFSAGIPGPNGNIEDNGLFGDITAVQTAVPEPSTWAMMLIGFAGLGFAFRKTVGRGAVCYIIRYINKSYAQILG